MKKWFIPLSAVLLLGVTIIFTELSNNVLVPNNIASVRLGETVVMAEVADTAEARSRGLGGRLSLSRRGGMLFIFDSSDQYGFWMKDMKFALDIIWIDSHHKVVDLSQDLQPETYPQTFRPIEPVLYVLEVRAGFVDERNVSIGDSVEIELP